MIKRILAFALVAIMLLSAIPVSAADGYGPWEFANNGTHQRVSLTDPNDIQTGTCEFQTTVVPTTCLYVGFQVHTCIYCQYSYKDHYAQAVGAHDFTGWLPNGDADFTNDGTETRTCKVCGQTETRTDENSALYNVLLGDFSFSLLIDAVKSGFGWIVTIGKMVVNVVKGIAG